MHPRTFLKPLRLAACTTLVLLAAAECGPEPPEPCDRPSRQTIVFFDQATQRSTVPPEIYLDRLRELELT